MRRHKRHGAAATDASRSDRGDRAGFRTSGVSDDTIIGGIGIRRNAGAGGGRGNTDLTRE